MKLQILVPQYHEDETVVKPMLDSIVPQQGIDFNEIEVVIGNDGSDVRLSDEFLNSYPFSIKYLSFEHSGVSGTRQRLFEYATADYIMYCDADDMFLTNLAIYTIFEYTKKSFDVLISAFVEELKDRNSGNYKYVTHKVDEKFIHGKVYRRRHLVDNNIKWYSDIQYHEDSGYNILAITTAKHKEHCDIPAYLWKWRDDSVCRSDPMYVLKTYNQMIQCNTYLIKDLLDRKMWDAAKSNVCSLIYNTYYTLNTKLWLDPMNAKYRYDTEKGFKQYFVLYKDLFNRVDTVTRMRILSAVKQRALQSGTLFEKFTFDEWIDHIEELD